MSDFKLAITDLADTVAAKAAIKAVQLVLADPPAPKRFLSTKEASQYLGLSTDVLQLWRSQGRGPSYRRICRNIRYDIRVLDSWMCGLTPGIDGSFVCGPEGTQSESSQEVLS